MVFPARPKTHGPLPGVPGRVDPLPTTVTPAEHLPGIPGRTGHLPSTRPRITSRIPGRPTVTAPGGWIPAGILSAHFTATGTLTATAFQVSKVTAAAAATATATATVLAKAKATAAFTASGKLTATIIAIGGGFTVNAPFTATGTATAVAFSQIKRPANFTATATATATTVEREFATAAFSGTATLTATNFARYASAAAFTATGTATGGTQAAVLANFTATGTLTAIARKPFTPSGMTKNAATMAMGTASPTQITGVVAESGSTVSTNALVANTSATTVVRGQVTLTDSYSSSYTAEIRRNGTAIPGATISGGNAMTGAPVLVIPATTVTITAGDLITIWITNPGSNCTIAAGTGTFVRLTAS